MNTNGRGNGDGDGESLPAVQSLRSKFEQLAVDTSSVKKSNSSEGLNARLRLSISSSDLKVLNPNIKRPPPPPPPRLNKPLASPMSSRSPSPMPVPVRPGSRNSVRDGDDGEKGWLSAVSALKHKFESKDSSPRPSITIDSPKPILPPRPLISVSPSNINNETPSLSLQLPSSRPVTPSPTPHHRPAPPPPPPPRSRSPMSSLVEIDSGPATGSIRPRLSPPSPTSSRQIITSTTTVITPTTTKVKPAIPPRPAKLVDSPQSTHSIFDTNTINTTPTSSSAFTYNVVRSPDSMSSSNSDIETMVPGVPTNMTMVPPAIPARRNTSTTSTTSTSTSTSNSTGATTTILGTSSSRSSLNLNNFDPMMNENDSLTTTGTTTPISKSFRTNLPPPPRHRSTLSPPSTTAININNNNSGSSSGGGGGDIGIMGTSNPNLVPVLSSSSSASSSGFGLPPPVIKSSIQSHVPPPLPNRRGGVGGEEQVLINPTPNPNPILRSPRILERIPPPPPPPLSASTMTSTTTSTSTSTTTTTGIGTGKTFGTNKLLPPPTRIIGLGDKLPPPRRSTLLPQQQGQESESDDDEGDDDDDDDNVLNSNSNSNSNPSNTNVNANANANSNTTTTTTTSMIDNIPDSSQSSRRPPLLSFNSKSQRGEYGYGYMQEPKIQVHPYNGICVTWGSIVVIGHNHFIKVYDLDNGNGGGNGDVPIGVLDVRELMIGSDIGVGAAAAGGGKDSKVSALEFRILGSGGILVPVLWIGTKEGCLFEVDVMCMITGGGGGGNGKARVRAMRMGAHSFPISHIFRYGRKMVSLDESGKTLIFSPPSGTDDNEEGNWDMEGGLEGVGGSEVGGGRMPLLNSQPRVVRTTEKQEFVKLLDGKLWTANRTETSSSSSSSHSHLSSSQNHSTLSSSHPHTTSSLLHGHGYQKLPIIRIYDIFNPTSAVGRSLLPSSHVGAITCATILPSNPGFVYVGHEGGYISIWGLRNTTTTTNTDNEVVTATGAGGVNYPKCLEVIRVGYSDVLCVEGVNDRLWVGGRNGIVKAFDVSLKPWIETNCWVAHEGVPVLRLNVNVGSVIGSGKGRGRERGRGRLCVVSVGRDECVRMWDGLLGVDWIEKEVQKQDQEYSSYRTLSLLLVSWNCDSAKPDSLNGDAINMDFLPSVLNSASTTFGGGTPDIIAFGFQEVIDLESRKMTAKNVLLGGSKSKLKSKSKSKLGSRKDRNKKKFDDFSSSGSYGINDYNNGTAAMVNGISEKVTGAYKRWFDKLSAEVRCLENNVNVQQGGGRYTAVHTENLVGLFTCIFVKEEERVKLKDGAVTTVKRGMGGRYGNKGGIVARFVIGDSSICIINCHLAAGQNAVRRRNADAAGILEEKEVFPIGDQVLAYVGGGDGSMVLDHEIVFFHGDLNYRIDQRRDAIIAAVKARDLPSLYAHDQLLREIKFNRGFRLRDFSEGLLTFDPTYKYDRRSNEYDSSEKHRAPAWCDRILWKSRVPGRVRLLEYRRYEVDVSDHRPVSALFEVEVKNVDLERREWVRRGVEERWVVEEERLLGFVKQFYFEQKVLV